MPFKLVHYINLRTKKRDMKIKKSTKRCNNVLFVTKSLYNTNKPKNRRRRFQKTPEKQKELNRVLSERKLLELIQNNFSGGDLHIVLSYDKDFYPATNADARKEIELFFRRLRYYYKNAGELLKYIQVTEYKNKRLHHHIIINNIDAITVSVIQNKLWKRGFVRCTPLEENGYYKELADYLIKETSKTFNTTERIFGKRYTSSRNLQLPEETEEIIQGNEKYLTDIPNEDIFDGSIYEIIKGSEYIGINDYTGNIYVTYAMKQTPPPGTKKPLRRRR